MAEFTHLHLHTEYSLLDGACDLTKLVDRVAALGQTVCRHDRPREHLRRGALFRGGQGKRDQADSGLRALYLARTKTTVRRAKGDDNNHLLVLAQNEEGYRNLIRITSEASLHGFYRKPRVSKRYLAEHCRGADRIFRLPERRAVRASVGGRVRKGARPRRPQYQDIFGKGNFYLEIQDQGLEQEKKIHEALFRLERELEIPMVADQRLALSVRRGLAGARCDAVRADGFEGARCGAVPVRQRPVFCEERGRDGRAVSRIRRRWSRGPWRLPSAAI